ncbi:MAG: hypothetical protein BGP16_07230 [Sphingobium sp. 66-54]|nr:MAG: hypothetical protein BGP16_07230 [Sphingobium sp. 66-54]
MARDTGKTARLAVGIWYNDRTGHIHVAAAGHFISTVSGDPASKRYHPNLYRKLATCLRDMGKPHPPIAPAKGAPEPC